MGLFQCVEGDVAIVSENGVYKQCDLFMRNGYLFAKVSGGFVRLMADGSTSKSRMRLETIVTEKSLGTDGMGRLMDGGADKARLLAPAKAALLLDKPEEAS